MLCKSFRFELFLETNLHVIKRKNLERNKSQKKIITNIINFYASLRCTDFLPLNFLLISDKYYANFMKKKKILYYREYFINDIRTLIIAQQLC